MGGFASAYDDGAPPWEIGRPQRDLAALHAAGEVHGSVLDVGCGTGEHALLFASLGHEAWGVDMVRPAIEIARRKAHARNLAATFLVCDALELGGLQKRFDTIVDSGLFHVFDDAERARYVESLAAVARPGTRYHALVWSEEEPPGGGPRRVTQDELRQAFARGWKVERIRHATYETNIHPRPPGGARAWLASIRRG